MHFGDLLKEVIKEYGIGVLDKDYLLSILLDKGLNTNRDISPAERAIINELCKEGVFKDIYKNCSKEKWELTFRRLAHHIIEDNGRQEQVVNSLFQEIAVALGFNASSTEWGSNPIIKSKVKVKVASEATKRAAKGVEKDAVVKKKSSSSGITRNIFGTMIASAAISFARHLVAESASGTKRVSSKKATSKKSTAGSIVKKVAKGKHHMETINEKAITDDQKVGYVSFSNNNNESDVKLSTGSPESLNNSLIDNLIGWVDLGLPSGTKWATCNIGASSPSDFGNYYAWGEVEDKKEYSWRTYIFSKRLIKYNDTDNKLLLDPENDAACINCGKKWRMPTINEWKELKNCCTWNWTTLNGTTGYKITGINNECSLFLPAVGLITGRDYYDVSSKGYYWSSERHPSEIETALCVHFYSDGTRFLSYTHRNIGFAIRPVLVIEQ